MVAEWQSTERQLGWNTTMLLPLEFVFSLPLFSYVYLHLGKVEQTLQISYTWSALQVNNM